MSELVPIMRRVRVRSRSRSRGRSGSRGPRPRSRTPAGRAPSQPRRRKKNRGPAAESSGSVGCVRLRNAEIFLEVKSGDDGGIATSVKINPDSNLGYGHLRKLAEIYDQIKWHSLKFEWVPAVGTTEGGIVVVGLDWDSKIASSDLTIAKVSGLAPNFTTALYKTSALTANVARFSFVNWFQMHAGTTVATLCVAGTGPAKKTVGYIRAHYDVSLQGPRLS